ncbi:MAG: DUF2911 domain-containing protein [Sphingobacteriales bacterium]|nr:DUF2911 domain-containing protein [Sphingobacteriales bacterium]
MNKIIITLIMITGLFSFATAQVRMPAPSSTQTIKQDFGLGSITLTYSRPNAKGRKIFGDLVPYEKIWRTGANAATRLVFTDPVEIGGKRIDTGTYVLYSMPGLDSWEFIINKGINNWGTDGYKESEDVCRFKIEPVKMKTKLESFTMQFANVKAESCELHVMWEKTALVIPISTNIKDKVRAQLEAGMLTDNKPYWQAAQFYKEYDNNPAKALENVTKATETNEKAYWIWIYKAKLQHEMGDDAGAMISSKKSLELALEAKNDDYVKMNKELQKKLK